jgi:hypothetical protein
MLYNSSTSEISYVGNTYLNYVTTTGVLSAAAFNSTSDIRSKTNVQELSLEYCKELIKKIHPVQYSFKNDTGTKRFGFIAQEVEQVITGEKLGLHHTAEPDGLQSIGYQELIAPLVKIIQEGLYYKGEAEIKDGCEQVQVSLPGCIKDCTVSVTPIGKPRIFGSSKVSSGTFYIYGPPGDYHWVVWN